MVHSGVEYGSDYVRVAGLRLHCLVAGSGPPLVLLHGLSASSIWWRRNIGALATRHRVYAVDLPGFGRSRPKRRFTLDGAVDALVAWMDAMCLPSANFCGHSMGGHLCIRLASAHPNRVRRLVLADASGLPFNTGILPLAWRSVRSGSQGYFSFTPTVVATALQAGPLVLYGALRGLLADDVRHDLARISAPTLIVWGQRDVLVPPEYGKEIAAAVSDSRLVILQGAGHNVMYERPAEFNRLVIDFLAGAAPIVSNAPTAPQAQRPAL